MISGTFLSEWHRPDASDSTTMLVESPVKTWPTLVAPSATLRVAGARKGPPPPFPSYNSPPPSPALQRNRSHPTAGPRTLEVARPPPHPEAGARIWPPH